MKRFTTEVDGKKITVYGKDEAELKAKCKKLGIEYKPDSKKEPGEEK